MAKNNYTLPNIPVWRLASFHFSCTPFITSTLSTSQSNTIGENMQYWQQPCIGSSSPTSTNHPIGSEQSTPCKNWNNGVCPTQAVHSPILRISFLLLDIRSLFGVKMCMLWKLTPACTVLMERETVAVRKASKHAWANLWGTEPTTPPMCSCETPRSIFEVSIVCVCVSKWTRLEWQRWAITPNGFVVGRMLIPWRQVCQDGFWFRMRCDWCSVEKGSMADDAVWCCGEEG